MSSSDRDKIGHSKNDMSALRLLNHMAYVYWHIRKSEMFYPTSYAIINTLKTHNLKLSLKNVKLDLNSKL